MDGFLIFLIIMIYFIALSIAVFVIIAQWKIYTKAGWQGWEVLIPVYNTIVLLKIAGKEWWWIFFYFIPIVNIVISIIVMIGLSKAFGKPNSFAVGLILLPIVFLPILAFGKAKYHDTEPKQTQIQTEGSKPLKGLSIAGLVLSIIALIVSASAFSNHYDDVWVSVHAIWPGTIALILGALGLVFAVKANVKRSFATAVILISIIAIGLSVYGYNNAQSMMRDYYDLYDYDDDDYYDDYEDAGDWYD